MTYSLETVGLTGRQEDDLKTVEVQIPRLAMGVIKMDRIRNNYIRGIADVE